MKFGPVLFAFLSLLLLLLVLLLLLLLLSPSLWSRPVPYLRQRFIRSSLQFLFCVCM